MSYSIRGIDHVVLRVADMEAMIRFYCDVVGAKLVARRPKLGLVHLRAGDAIIDLLAGKPDGRNMDHFCLQVEPFDAEAIVAHLARHGVSPQGEIRPRFGAEGTGTSLYLKDPEGNIVELKGPSDGALTPP